MTRDPNPMMPAPANSATVTSVGVGVQCPFCRSPQFFGEKRMTSVGITLLIVGFVGMLISIPLMLIYIGICSFILFLPFPLIAAFQRKYVNVCAKCRRVF